MSLETFPFDTARFLTEPEDREELLAEALATGDPAVIKHALGIVVRARGAADIARGAGVDDEALKEALGPAGDLSSSTLLDVLAALGIKLSATLEQPLAAA